MQAESVDNPKKKHLLQKDDIADTPVGLVITNTPAHRAMSESLDVPQALQTGYSSRLRLGKTSLMISSVPAPRKRGITYADFADEFDDDEEDPSFGAREESPASSSRHSRHDPTAGKVEVKRQAIPSRHVPYTEQQTQDLASTEEILVPIRLAFDVEHYKVVDFFLWNVHETSLTPEQFAIMTCQELELPVGYTSNIVNAIKTQLSDFAELASIKIPEDAGLHVVINISVNLDKRLLEDKFEWDLSTTELSPAEFARTVVADLGLDREFFPAITHAIYEQILRMKRAIFVEGRLIDIVNDVGPHARSREAGIRITDPESADDWAPSLDILSQSDLERREMERVRMIRRLKRDSSRAMSEIDIGSMLSRKRRRHTEF